MRTEIPITPDFDRELEMMLRVHASSARRARLPFALSSLARLRRLSSLTGHGAAAVVMSAVLLLMSPATVNREAQLPPISEPPRSGYLAQYGVTPSPDKTIAVAREGGFEVEVVTTYVAGRTTHGEIVAIRHVSKTVSHVPVDQGTRGPLFIVIGLAISDAGKTAD
jgi:hypothetical protein